MHVLPPDESKGLSASTRAMYLLEQNFAWLYIVIFLAIPLARILPRVIRKIKNGQSIQGSYSETTKNWNVTHTEPQSSDSSQTEPQRSAKSQTGDMQVLGQLIAGASTFEGIQKYTGIATEKLDKILQDLESTEMITVNHKQGLFGAKIQIRPTSRGVRAFHN